MREHGAGTTVPERCYEFVRALFEDVSVIPPALLLPPPCKMIPMVHTEVTKSICQEMAGNGGL